MQVGWSILLIIHGILAVFLVGAITHQAIGAALPVAKRGGGFFSAVRGVNGVSYTNAVIVLFAATFALGCIIYPAYRINVRTALQEYRLFKPEGMFEMKEHLLALGLALLPVYWFLWRGASSANRVARTVVTAILAVAVWWSFLTGHIINNIRGFGS
jgi:flagellar biosynthesis protein FlhB